MHSEQKTHETHTDLRTFFWESSPGAAPPTCEFQANLYRPIISFHQNPSFILLITSWPCHPGPLPLFFPYLLFFSSISLDYYIQVSQPHTGLSLFPSPPFIPQLLCSATGYLENQIFSDPHHSEVAWVSNSPKA